MSHARVLLVLVFCGIAAGQSSIHNLQGFAEAATGGGLLPDSDPDYRRVYNATELADALARPTTRIIEVMTDLDLGFDEIEPAARTGALRSAPVPLMHPALMASGVSLIDVQDEEGLTIFSAGGAAIRHAALRIKRSSNIIVRNLKFDELWEWDEYSRGQYDKQDWDFITIDANSNDIWIDHCTFTRAYDGAVDIKGGTRNVTISWSSFLGDDGGEGSFVRRQIEALERDRTAPMYNFLRESGFTAEDIIAIARPQKKGHLIGAGELDDSNASHRVTLHHNYYRNMQDRVPRLRAGNAHAFNICVDDTEALAAKERRSAVVAAMSPADVSKLSGSKAIYSFDVTLNGSISTEDGAVALENSVLIDVLSPLRNNQKDASLTQYTGKIRAADTIYRLRGVSFRGGSDTPGSPLAPVPAATLPFSWNAFADLPYTYSAQDAAEIEELLTGPEGAGAGRANWSREDWLKTSYESANPQRTGSSRQDARPD